ncbi:hypothetical protein L1887_11075 [Cichorium endivia]|nr:hypothetical protein L1887_11075 [Cichorium endivia]
MLIKYVFNIVPQQHEENKEKGKRGDSPNLNPVSHCTSHGKIKAVLLPTSFFLFQFHTEILEIQKKSRPAKNPY